MTDQKRARKRDKKVKVEKLEVSKETVQDLKNTQAERAKGGAAGGKRLTYFDGC
jgi:hypothetical protein